MSAFVKASVVALKDIPAVNGVIDDDEIVYRDYVDISLAVATPKGLVVPVVRNADLMSFADVEKVGMVTLHPPVGNIRTTLELFLLTSMQQPVSVVVHTLD